jgi:hypothetical protein
MRNAAIVLNPDDGQENHMLHSGSYSSIDYGKHQAFDVGDLRRTHQEHLFDASHNRIDALCGVEIKMDCFDIISETRLDRGRIKIGSPDGDALLRECLYDSASNITECTKNQNRLWQINTSF